MTELYGKIVNKRVSRLGWSKTEPKKEDGWYALEREPDFLTEYLEYDKTGDRIVIKKRKKSPEQIQAERRWKIKQQLQGELTDLILSNKDDPEGLAQALCDRAKQLEKEMP